MRSPKIEGQGLLQQPETFDIDEPDDFEPTNGYSHDRSNLRSRRGNRFLRPRMLICGLLALAILLATGTAVNKGAGSRVQRLLHHGSMSAEESENDQGSLSPTLTVVNELGSEKSADTETSDGISASSVEVDEPEASIPQLTISALLPASTYAPPYSSPGASKTTLEAFDKPTDFKIIGLIFFGRPWLVDILNCYLKKNLVFNGGWLDEVHFVVNTKSEDDIAYLDWLVGTSPLYKKKTMKKLGYNEIWKTLEPEHMYIKIDDDIVRVISSDPSCSLTNSRCILTTMQLKTLYIRNCSTTIPTVL